jgi:ATP-dependent Clp protease ATP-binding subunit ClpA
MKFIIWRTGSAEGSLDANILKPVLSRSGFQCIGDNNKEYQRMKRILL